MNEGSKQQAKEDFQRMVSPIPATIARPAHRWPNIILACEALLIFGLLAYFGIRLTSNRPVTYSDPKEHFKYGSTGGEILNGIP
jgi:hypothetical protein